MSAEQTLERNIKAVQERKRRNSLAFFDYHKNNHQPPVFADKILTERQKNITDNDYRIGQVVLYMGLTLIIREVDHEKGTITLCSPEKEFEDEDNRLTVDPDDVKKSDPPELRASDEEKILFYNAYLLEEPPNFSDAERHIRRMHIKNNNFYKHKKVVYKGLTLEIAGIDYREGIITLYLPKIGYRTKYKNRLTVNPLEVVPLIEES